MHHWTLRAAKDQLSRLVEAAQAEPQAISKRGRGAVVVVSQREYERLLQRREPLTSFFARAGLEDVEIARIEGAMREEGEI